MMAGAASAFDLTGTFSKDYHSLERVFEQTALSGVAHAFVATGSLLRAAAEELAHEAEVADSGQERLFDPAQLHPER